MPDDERTRRRLGDATKARIDDLASGWTVESKPPEPAPEPPPAAPRSKPRTVPPPPPGSDARKALEEAIIATAGSEPADASKPTASPPGPRTKPPSAPPAPRSKPPTTPPASAAHAFWTAEPGQLADVVAPAPAKPITNPPSPPKTNPPSAPITNPPSPPGALANASGAAAPITNPPSAPKPITSPPSAPKPITNPPSAPKPITSPPAPPRPIATPPNASSTAAPITGAAKPSTNPPPIPKPPTIPPPLAADRSKPPSKPPPIPPPKAGQLAFPPERTPPVIIDASLVADAAAATPENLAKLATPPGTPTTPVADSSSRLAVPVGEFDSGVQTIDEDKLRVAFAHATVKRDAAEALLQIEGAPPTVVKPPSVETLLGETAEKLRGDPTSIDPKTQPFERADPTSEGNRDDATEIQAPRADHALKGGTLRVASMLRRQRGVIGDVRYVSTALFGVRQSRRELVELEERQKVRQTSRKHHLVTLGRTAVSAEGLDHPALGKSREALQAVEDERSKHAGAVAASDAELERVRRDREAKAKQYATDVTATEAELVDLTKKLEPLEKEAAAARKRAAELGDQLRRIARKIADTEALLVSVKSEKMDRAGIQAEIATLKADQKAVQRDEPAIAAELDTLNPRIAAIHAARTEAEKKKADLVKAEAEDQRRTTELYEAIGAKRKVVERAAAEAEAARDKVLFELGERLYVDRPAVLAAQLSPIDRIDLELGESDRRVMELREILSNIDRAKLLRGTAVIVATLAAVAAFAWWVIAMI